MTAIGNPLDLFRLDGRCVVVTGASSGLGDRFARVAHAAGADVVVAARRAERLEALTGELPGSHAVAVDLSQPADRERLVASAIDRFGKVDVLVNNAGVGQKIAIEEEDLDMFRTAMELNVTVPFLLCRALVLSALGRVRGRTAGRASGG